MSLRYNELRLHWITNGRRLYARYVGDQVERESDDIFYNVGNLNAI